MIKLSISERDSAVYLNDFKKFTNIQKASIFCLVKEDYVRLFSTLEKYILPKLDEGINLQMIGCILDQLSIHGLEKANELFEQVGAGVFHDKGQMMDIVKRFVIEMINGFEGKKPVTNMEGVIFSAVALLEKTEAVVDQPMTKEEKEYSFEKIKGELLYRSNNYQAALNCLEKAVAIKEDKTSNNMVMSCKFSLLGRELGASLLPRHMTLQDRDDLRFDDWIAAGEADEVE